VKVGDVVKAAWRTMVVCEYRGPVVDLDEMSTVSAGGWLGVVHAVRGPGRGRKARSRTREVDVYWSDGRVTTEVGVAEHLEVIDESR